MQIINEYSYEDRLTLQQMDMVWSRGWRHFGTYFFRYNVSPSPGGFLHVLPLRIRLSRFFPSKSQRRILKRNAHLRVVVRPTVLDDQKHMLFERHKTRFTENIPDSLLNFMEADAATTPCRNVEVCLYDQNRLIGVSFLDVGFRATSSVYAMFDPAYSKHSPGIFMILQSIEYSKRQGKLLYYPGYAHRETSFYDYKKKFSGLEYYDWNQSWLPFIEQTNE